MNPSTALATESTCDHKMQLAHNYSIYADQHARAVKALRQRMGIVPERDYSDLLRATEDARELSEKARLALEKHTAEHGC